MSDLITFHQRVTGASVARFAEPFRTVQSCVGKARNRARAGPFRVDLADADELAEHGAEVDLASAEADASAAAAGRWPTKLKTFRVKRNAADWARRVEDEMVRGVFIAAVSVPHVE